jgi:hypothetical protein
VDLKLLIDSIVRQTMVLIAQLSTTHGSRSPLAHVADQVFLELTREIEAQGVCRQVVADMFGMALRSYQKKVRRIEESSSDRERSLWQAVLEFVQQESPSRTRIDERFRYDGEREIAAVLQDLLRSGLIFTTGSGASLVYGATSQQVRDTVQGRQDVDALANLLWVKVFHREATTLAELRQVSSASPETLEADISPGARYDAYDNAGPGDGVLRQSPRAARRRSHRLPFDPLRDMLRSPMTSAPSQHHNVAPSADEETTADTLSDEAILSPFKELEWRALSPAERLERAWALRARLVDPKDAHDRKIFPAP